MQVVEHHFQADGHNPAPMVVLAAAAGATERIGIGTNALLVSLYNPVKLAEDIAVLDNISGGRLSLVVAPGYVREEFDGLMVPYDERFKRFEEALDLMQAAWTNKTSRSTAASSACRRPGCRRSPSSRRTLRCPTACPDLCCCAGRRGGAAR